MDQAASLLELQRLDLEILHGKKRLDELPEKQAILDVRHKLRDVSALRHKADVLVQQARKRPEGASGRDREPDRQDRRRAGQGHVDHRPSRGDVTDPRDGRTATPSRQARDGVARTDGPDREGDSPDRDDRRRDRRSSRTGKPPPSLSTSPLAGRCRMRPPTWKRDRRALAESLDAKTLTEYEALRESKGGVGVGQLDGDTCSACRMSLPAERISELTSGPDVGRLSALPSPHRRAGGRRVSGAVLRTDGGSRGNPGPAGAGFVIEQRRRRSSAEAAASWVRRPTTSPSTRP